MLTLPAVTIDKVAYNGCTIVRLNDDNIGDVTALHKTVYGKPPTHDFYYRKYNTGFIGKKYLGYIAYNGEKKPVAFNGVVPCYVKTDGKLIVAAQCADAMTHPQYRMRGLFTKVGALLIMLCKQEGIALLFGFPNQNSRQAMVTKLGWQQMGYMDNFTIPVPTIPIKSIFSRLLFLNGLYKMFERLVIAKYLSGDMGVANSTLRDGYNGIYRDDTYINYKAFTRTLVIKAGKSKVWISLTNGALMVGDIKLLGELDEVITILKKLAIRLGLRKIHFITSENTILHKLFSEKYQPTQVFPVIFQAIQCDVDTERIKFVFADIDIF